MNINRFLSLIVAGAFFALAAPSVALAQNCNGQFGAGQFCGNSTAGNGFPSPQSMTTMLDRNFGGPSAQGTILNRGVSAWSATINPVIGKPGTSTGTLGLGATAGGTATITPAAVAGNTAFQLPSTSGTFPSTATSPLVLNPVTGVLTCPTCVTGTAGALTIGTTAVSGATAGQILYSDGSLLQAGGAVKAISIALGGATIGSDGLGVTGTATISSTVTGGTFVPTLNSIPTDGMYLNAAGQVAFAAGSTRIFFINSAGLLMANASGATLSSSAASTTQATLIPRRSDSGTGIGSSGTASISLIATSIEQLRINNGSIYVGGAASGSNTAAVAPTVSAALSTGNATNPDLVFQTGVATTSGSSQATATTALTIKGETQALLAPSTLTILNGTVTPAGGTAGSGYKFSSTSNFGVFFGSGVPTLSAAQGSIYLRSDGLPYYNTNGTTGWTAVATSASAITALTGDVTATGPGSVAATLATAQPAVHTWALAQTFTVAPVFTDQSGSRTALGLGSMATQNANAVAITGGSLAGTLSGTPTFSGANFITLANIVQNATAWSLLGNASGGTANNAAFTFGGLTNKASPAGTDLVLIQDQAAGGQLKNVQVSALGGGGSGVTTLNTLTGGVSLITNMYVRLTLISHTPIFTSTVTSATTIYATCAGGGAHVFHYNGTSDVQDTIPSCEVSTVMQASSTGVLNANNVFDVWWTGTTICIATNGSGGGWASDTGGSNVARGTGYSQLDTTTRSYPTNKNALTNCYNGPTNLGTFAANRVTYFGSILTDAASAGVVSVTFPAAASGGSAGRIGLWNMWNPNQATVTVADSKSSWTYGTTAVFQQMDNSAGNQVVAVVGVAALPVDVKHIAAAVGTAGVLNAVWGIGLDSVTAPVTGGTLGMNQASATAQSTSSFDGIIGVGAHTIAALQSTLGTGTATFYGTGAINQQTQALTVKVWN